MTLNEYGFEKVGEWKQSNRGKSGIAFKLQKFEAERVVYAFVVDEQAKYIGICQGSSTTLKDRMKRYKNLQGGGTNERIVNKIKECLKSKKTVEIFALKPESSYQYNSLNIDLVKGLENSLIEKLKPEWNIQKWTSENLHTLSQLPC